MPTDVISHHFCNYYSRSRSSSLLKYTFITKTLYHKHFILMDSQSMWMKTTVNTFETVIKCVVESIKCFWMNKMKKNNVVFSISPPSIDACMHLRSAKITKYFASDKCIESVDPHAQNNSILTDWLIDCVRASSKGHEKAKQNKHINIKTFNWLTSTLPDKMSSTVPIWEYFRFSSCWTIANPPTKSTLQPFKVVLWCVDSVSNWTKLENISWNF